MKDNLVNESGGLVNDCISRQAAIDALMEILDRPNHAEFLYTDEICRALNHLPSAQPQRMKGKWERHYNRPNVFADLYWHCSICGYKNSENWANIYHRYCPHCGSEMLLESHEEVSYSPSSGADMRGEQDG